MPPGEIRTHDLSRRATADLRLRPRGHWDWRSRGIAPLILNLGTRCSGLLTSRPWPLYLRARTSVGIEFWAGWAPGLVWCFGEKSFACVGIRTPTLATRSLNWRASWKSKLLLIFSPTVRRVWRKCSKKCRMSLNSCLYALWEHARQ